MDPVPETASPPAPALDPVTLRERIDSIDVLRGVALLGILIVNIYAFAYPIAGYSNPGVFGGDGPGNVLTWAVTHTLVEAKFISIFAMLFGAGMWLMSRRAEERGGRFRRVYLRRLGFLALIGLAHAYLIWWGDVLFSYAVTGAIIFGMRNWPTRRMLIVASVSFILSILITLGNGFAMRMLEGASTTAAELRSEGEIVPPDTAALASQWDDVSGMMDPSPEQAAAQVETYRGGYAGILRDRLAFVPMQQMGSLAVVIPRVAGLMLLGIVLMKTGVLSAARSNGFYLRMMSIGYAIGLPLALASTFLSIRHGFDPVSKFSGDAALNVLGSVPMALGHLSVVMLLIRADALGALQRRLAAVGRMALTNYLAQSIIATTIFYGYGGGLFNQIDRPLLMGFVLAIWVVQLVLSPWWLSRFRFGPAEWLWRSLTYGRPQPLRRVTPQEA